MNIILYEMRAYRRSTLIWTVALVVLVVLFMSLYPSISKDIADFKKLLAGFPVGVRQAFGIQIDTIGTIVGFYAYIFLYISLCGAIQAMNLGLSIISKETREKTADFLFTKPVTRKKVLLSKLFAALLTLLITNVIYLIAVSIVANFVKTTSYNHKVFFMISLTLFFVQLIFLTLGVAISVIIPKLKSVITVSLSVVFMFYIIGMVASTVSNDVGRYLSPFKYFDPTYIMNHESYEGPFVILSLAIMLVSLVTSFLIYTRKDIYTV